MNKREKGRVLLAAWLKHNDRHLWGLHAKPMEAKALAAADLSFTEGIVRIAAFNCEWWLNEAHATPGLRQLTRSAYDSNEWQRQMNWLHKLKASDDLHPLDTFYSVTRRMRWAGIKCSHKSVREAARLVGIVLPHKPPKFDVDAVLATLPVAQRKVEEPCEAVGA